MEQFIRENFAGIVAFAFFLFLLLGWQLDRMEKQLNKMTALLLHIREVRDGAHEEYEINKRYEDERRQKSIWRRFR